MTDRGFTNQPEGATPIHDASGLRRNDVHTLSQLNEAEALNIVSAIEWIENGRVEDVFSIKFYRELHRRMLDEVWTWAGNLRRSDTNIGVKSYQIPTELGAAARDFGQEWKSKTGSLVEFIARYHHRLVWVHPFPNGNGRWSRLACDVVVARLSDDATPIAWVSGGDLVGASDERDQYIAALRAADGNDLQPLVVYLTERNPSR